jgi:hypothetical protein
MTRLSSSFAQPLPARVIPGLTRDPAFLRRGAGGSGTPDQVRGDVESFEMVGVEM